ncbi:hypothetical protein HSX10_13385 [Winogradskyella undariae]|uniref:hypothetical protein n=1 Tax=Winogradskyella undariae TaxID=1285465 RepID=UPI00156B176B|nr:hypothetical protein [Winogradskyella undariae]NRR92561.1 hypothetical protein [Winogradskyella undariae]
MKKETYLNTGKSIHIFNEIELFLNLIITHHIDPKDKSFFLEYILNTSVISFGAKIKILINLDIFNKEQIKKIRKLSNNRNVFAHTNRDSHYVDELIQDPTTNSVEIKIKDIILETNSEGKLNKTSYKDFIENNIKLQNEIIDFISEYIIINKINTHYNHIENLKLLK